MTAINKNLQPKVVLNSWLLLSNLTLLFIPVTRPIKYVVVAKKFALRTLVERSGKSDICITVYRYILYNLAYLHSFADADMLICINIQNHRKNHPMEWNAGTIGQVANHNWNVMWWCRNSDGLLYTFLDEQDEAGQYWGPAKRMFRVFCLIKTFLSLSRLLLCVSMITLHNLDYIRFQYKNCE